MGHFPRAFLERILQEFDAAVAAGTSRPTVEDAGRFLCVALQREQGDSDELPVYCGLAVPRSAVGESRLERFRLAHGIERRELIARAGISRGTYHDLRKGNDTHLSTIRAVVRAAAALLGRPVKATDLFDLGSGTPSGTVTIPRKVVPLRQRGSLKKFATTLDRVLRREQILHNDFAAHIGVSRQTLLRYRSGQLEPSLVTLARMVETLRGMTGRPYKAKHLYDVGEEGS